MLFFLKHDCWKVEALVFPLELVMGFLRVRASPMVFCALISASGSEMESEMLSFVFVRL